MTLGPVLAVLGHLVIALCAVPGDAPPSRRPALAVAPYSWGRRDGGDWHGGGWMNSADDLMAVALLAEPVRQRLYRYVRDRREPVGREEAARNAGISVKLAAFHLDRMAEAGLLDVGYRRLTGRVGPGAGRPAKVYTASPRSFSVALPQTRYELAASMMATALSGDTSAGGLAALEEVAGTVGDLLGSEVTRQARTRQGRREAALRQLEQLGFEPQVRGAGRDVVLRNCIFRELSDSHRELVCGMNAALVRGLLAGAELRSLRVEGRPAEERVAESSCCVRIVGR
jgi:predicted ArsR family transcriptional regulator